MSKIFCQLDTLYRLVVYTSRIINLEHDYNKLIRLMYFFFLHENNTKAINQYQQHVQIDEKTFLHFIFFANTIPTTSKCNLPKQAT